VTGSLMVSFRVNLLLSGSVSFVNILISHAGVKCGGLFLSTT